MRSFSQVSLSLDPSRWARNEFQEERQRVYNDGEVKRYAKRAPKDKKRGKENRRCWSRQKLIWLRTFIAKSPSLGEDKRKYVYVLSFSLLRGERPRKRRSGYYQNERSKDTLISKGAFKRETEKTLKSFEF